MDVTHLDTTVNGWNQHHIRGTLWHPITVNPVKVALLTQAGWECRMLTKAEVLGGFSRRTLKGAAEASSSELTVVTNSVHRTDSCSCFVWTGKVLILREQGT